MRPRGRGFSFLRKQSFLDPGGHPTAARFLNQLSAGKGDLTPPTPAAASAGFHRHRHHHGPPTVVLATARFACAKSICVLDLRARRGTALAFVLCACLKQRRLAGGDLRVLSGSFLSVPGRVARVLISARESARFLNVTVS